MGRVRNEPQSVVREPMSEGAPPHGGARRACAEPGAACAAPDVEPGQGNALWVLGGLGAIAHGGQQSGGWGGAEARPLPPSLAVPTRLQARDSRRAPQVLLGQRVRESVRPGFARKLVETVGGSEPHPLESQVLHGWQCLGGPLAPVTTGLPLVPEAPAAMAYAGL
jgi:hypothetical protein